MKHMFIIVLILALSACSPQETQPTQKSDEIDIVSQDSEIARIEGDLIYMKEGTSVNNLFDIIEAVDSSEISKKALNSEGEQKQSDMFYEYEQIEITSESGNFSKVYFIRYM